MRSLSSRENTSHPRSPRWVCSITVGISATVAKLAGMGVRVHCLALGGVDLASSTGKLTMNVINAVAEFERDLLVERRGGAIDFTAPHDGAYTIKVHDLTFNGGPAFYYRLGLWELPPGAPVVRQPAPSRLARQWPVLARPSSTSWF